MKVYSLVAAAAAVASADNSEQARCSTQECRNVIKESISNGIGGRSLGKKASAVVVNDSKISTFLNVDAPAAPGPQPKKRFGMKFTLPVINNYGCWCYGGEYWPGARDWTGFGPFMDEYDDACKAHHQGFDCIAMDAEDENETCDPPNTQYSLLVTPQANGDYTLECNDTIENDWCKRRVCMVDLRFIARHWELERNGVEPDYASFGHAGFHNNAGDFNTDVCILPRTKGPGGHEKVEKRCCGDYPYRVWYDKKNVRGLRCCEYEDSTVNADYGFSIKIGKLYNRLSATCCDYGVINDGNQCA